MGGRSSCRWYALHSIRSYPEQRRDVQPAHWECKFFITTVPFQGSDQEFADTPPDPLAKSHVKPTSSSRQENLCHYTLSFAPMHGRTHRIDPHLRAAAPICDNSSSNCNINVSTTSHALHWRRKSVRKVSLPMTCRPHKVPRRHSSPLHGRPHSSRTLASRAPCRLDLDPARQDPTTTMSALHRAATFSTT